MRGGRRSTKDQLSLLKNSKRTPKPARVRGKPKVIKARYPEGQKIKRVVIAYDE